MGIPPSMRYSMMAAFALALAVNACGEDRETSGDDSSPTSGSNAATSTQTCNALEGNTYVTVEDQSSGSRCYFDTFNNYVCEDVVGSWSVTFDDGMVFWSKGQNSSYGDYSCDGTKVTATLDGTTVTGTLSGSVLTWDGDRYDRA